MCTATPYWYALHVKSRQEFVTEEVLQQKGVKSYLPSIQKPRQWKDRRKLVKFPLFPGYLFVNIVPREEELLTVLRARGVVAIITGEPGRPVPVPEEDIAALMGLVESGEEVDIYPHLKEGTRVRVKRGVLQGAIGLCSKREDRYIFLVNIEILGRSVGVKLFAEDIEAL